jgi:phosphoenolpyruvate carboxylase
MRAVEVFGFHLATVDLRQSSDKHEEVVAELLATGPHRTRLTPALTKTGKRDVLLRLLNDARPIARTRALTYSAHTGPRRTRHLRQRQASCGNASALPPGHPPLHHQPHRDR